MLLEGTLLYKTTDSAPQIWDECARQSTPVEGTLLLKTTDFALQNRGESTRQLKQGKICLWRWLALFDCNCSFPVITDYL